MDDATMDWDGDWDWDEVYEVIDKSRPSSAGDAGLIRPGDPALSIKEEKRPEVIVIDEDSPVQAQSQHDEISCKNDILLIFPDICPDYLTQLSALHNHRSDAVSSAILDKQEKDGKYPTRPIPETRSRKRKRFGGIDGLECDYDYNSDEEDEGDENREPESVRSIKLEMAAQGYTAKMLSPEYGTLGRTLISQDFPRVPQVTIRSLLAENKWSVFNTYTAMDEKLRNCDGQNMPWTEKKTLTKTKQEFTPDRFSSLDMSSYKPEERAALAEFSAARELRAAKDAKLVAIMEEKNNFIRAQLDGQTSECGICFEEFALNRMIRCEGEIMHWFCRVCLRTQAESQIGMARYDLVCMSMDGCSSGFSREQRRLFLDKKLTVALDRIEQEAVLRMAGIENLETCPFCSYAAEYPIVEVDKEFRCENPRCEKVSCRLCRKETHIPKTCAEADADRGLDARHILEEAMSEALIRRCNKCKNPFVKQDGCNKIRCTKCGTLQCDVCRQTIKDYSHFNDTNRGGKVGQCPLFDVSEDRYKEEVSKAEVETRKRVVEENPEVDEAALHIPVSKGIQESEDKTKLRFPVRPLPGRHRNWGRLARVVHDRPRVQLGDRPGHIQPNELLARHYHGEPNGNNPRGVNLAVQGGVQAAFQPFLGPPPDGRRNGLLKGAGGLVQASKQLVRAKERNAPLRFGELRQNDMIRLAAPHPGAFGNILNKVENLKIKKDAQPEQPIGVAQHAGHVAPNQPQQIAQIQVAADPFVAFHFPWNIPPQPIPGVGHVLGDRVNASANQVEAPQPKRLTNLNLLEPPDDPLYAYAFGRLNP